MARPYRRTETEVTEVDEVVKPIKGQVEGTTTAKEMAVDSEGYTLSVCHGKDGTGTKYVISVDNEGHQQIDIVSMPVNSYTTDSILIYGHDGTDARAVKTDSDGHVQVDVLSIQDYDGTILRMRYDSGNINVTATGTTSSIDTVTGFEKHTWTQVNDASESNPDIRLQGSIDGTNWFDLDTSTSIGSEMRHVVNKPVRYIRFNVVSLGDATIITLRYFGFR